MFYTENGTPFKKTYGRPTLSLLPLRSPIKMFIFFEVAYQVSIFSLGSSLILLIANNLFCVDCSLKHPTTPREPQLKCEQCDKLFLTKGGLFKHGKKDHGENGRNELEVSCHLCTLTFSGNKEFWT